MRIYTAHLRDKAPPVLLREGFSFGAFLFGPFWLLAQRAWIPGILLLCLEVALAALPRPACSVVGLGLAWMIGLTARDMLRWSLGRRGFLFAHVVAAEDDDRAWLRLMMARPDLIEPVVP